MSAAYHPAHTDRQPELMAARWEAEIRIRRNGRLVKRESALGDTPAAALYYARNDLERWAEDQDADDDFKEGT